MGCKTKSLLSVINDSLASHPPDLLRPKMVGRLLKKNFFTKKTLNSKSRVKCFRIYSNERFSCRFHFLLQGFFCVVSDIFLLFCFSSFDEHSKCSGHFLKLCAEDPQHNFFCMMYFFTISYHWTNIINLPNVVSISWLYLFISNDSFLCQINGCESIRRWIQ